MGRFVHDGVHVAVQRRAGAQNGAVRHGARAQAPPPRRSVDDDPARAEGKKPLPQAGELVVHRRPAQLHKAVGQGAENDDLPHGRVHAGDGDNFARRVAQGQKPLGGGNQGASADINRRLGRVGDHVAAFAVTADRGQRQPLASLLGRAEQRIQHGGFPGVFAHAGQRQHRNAAHQFSHVHKNAALPSTPGAKSHTAPRRCTGPDCRGRPRESGPRAAFRACA